ncbi:hypothetical protein AC578_7930 [Pseudocercospora eumusae]|uniref:Uncharacterized protein n=1 Tax=Pseudocercospora eumusae TaxID=321146 RepID=A0A139HPB7_9PEZI|nr:hypothetical protein AC578_7930 [Pseudocercospora eumusae]
MPLLAVVDVEHVRTASPSDVASTSKHQSHYRRMSEQGQEEDSPGSRQRHRKYEQDSCELNGEDEEIRSKTEDPACGSKSTQSAASQDSEHMKPSQQLSQDELPSGFILRWQRNRAQIRDYIRAQGLARDGTLSGKAGNLEIPKSKRFDQIAIWRDQRLDGLEKSKMSKGTYRSEYPEIYKWWKATEDVYWKNYFSAWLDAPEKSSAEVTSTSGRTILRSVESQYYAQDQDDEEIIPIKPEIEDDDVERMTSNYEYTPSVHRPPPLRKATRISHAHGNMREPSTPESDKIYYAQQQSNPSIKRKREAEASMRATKVQQEDEEDAASDSSEDDVCSRQPRKKYVAVGPNGHFNGAKATPQNLECTLRDGKVVKAVRRAWIWDENGRMVVYPAF